MLELEADNAALRHDIARSMANHAADLGRPCECVGCICIQQTTPHMMLANTFCKMPRASALETRLDPDDAPINLDGFDKPGAVFKIGGKVVSRDEGLEAFRNASRWKRR